MVVAVRWLGQMGNQSDIAQAERLYWVSILSSIPLAIFIFSDVAARHAAGKRRFMLGKAQTCAIVGLDGALVEVEVDIGHGLPSFTIVGLPDAAVQESKERVRAALKNSGAIFPMKRLTVNLAPADLRKEGPAYDLPIAVAILLASEQVFADVTDALFLGELSLDGALRHTDGILP